MDDESEAGASFSSTHRLWYCLDGEAYSKVLKFFSFMRSAPWALSPHSPHTAPHGAFHHLDRNLAFDGFIHSLMQSHFSDYYFFFSFSRNSAGASEHKCVLTGRRVHIYIYIWGRNAQVNFLRTTTSRHLKRTSTCIPANTYCCCRGSFIGYLVQTHTWTKSRESACLCNRLFILNILFITARLWTLRSCRENLIEHTTANNMWRLNSFHLHCSAPWQCFVLIKIHAKKFHQTDRSWTF